MKHVVWVSCALAAALLAGPALGGPRPHLREEGGRLFMEYGCYGCHEVDGVGTPIGPRLGTGIHGQSQAEIVRWLRDPSACKEHALMPRIALSASEIKALAAWLVSLE